MSKGKRYSGEKKLNMKKVAAVIMAFAVLVMFVVIISILLQDNPNQTQKTFPTAYYPVYENNKWGVIDTKGNVVISPSYDEMIVIPDSSKPVFICTHNVDYETGTYETSVINEKNQEIYTNYDKVEALDNHDENNNLWYEKTVLKAQKDGKYGLISIEGKELLPCEYEKIEVLSGVSSVFCTTKDGQKGLVDIAGNTIIENAYVSITGLTTAYENGFIVEAQDGKYGVIGYDKSTKLEPKYEEIQHVYGNGMYVVKENGTWKVIDEDENVKIEGGFDSVVEIQPNAITIQKNGAYGVVTENGQELIPAEYTSLTYAFDTNYIAQKEGKYGMIDTSNQTKMDFNYASIVYHREADFIQAENSDGQSELLDRDFAVKVTGIVSEINTNKNYIRVRVGEDYQYYNFRLEQKPNTEILSTNTLFLSKQDGKYGYVNGEGVVVVNYIYDDATEQNNYGYVAVKKDGKWGAIDAQGNVVVEPTYTLENNLVVDFIGQWHLAEDINAYYYTK